MKRVRILVLALSAVAFAAMPVLLLAYGGFDALSPLRSKGLVPTVHQHSPGRQACPGGKCQPQDSLHREHSRVPNAPNYRMDRPHQETPYHGKQFMRLSYANGTIVESDNDSKDLKADAAHGVRYDARELVLQLPLDGDKPSVTVFGDGPAYDQVVRWFDDNAQLRRLKDRSHFRTFNTRSQIYRERYAATMRTDLKQVLIRIQASDGRIVQDFLDGQVPMTAEAFIRQANSTQAIVEACSTETGRPHVLPWNVPDLNKDCPNGDCNPNPKPQPNVDPQPQPLTPAPVPAPHDDSQSWLWLPIVAGCLTGLILWWKKAFGV